MRTKVMLFIGGVALVLAVRMYTFPFVSREWGLILSALAGLLYLAFAFTDNWKRTCMAATLTLLFSAGYFYFLDFRRDAVGFVIMAGCGIVAYLMMRQYKRRELQQS